MAEIDRKSALCDQDPIELTGIDFIQVVDPEVQTVLRIFFVVDPSTLVLPLVNAGVLVAPVGGQTAGPPVVDLGLSVTIVSEDTGQLVEIENLAWRIVRTPAGNRIVLEVSVREPGDSSFYRLTIDDDRIDRFFNRVRFSFKQGCPSEFDCRVECDPEPEASVDFPVDYLARDFQSIRRALLDFAAQRYPQWSEPLEADQAVMLMEIMASLGDELAYTQDRYDRETSLETATQRRSRSSLARLVDYFPDPGSAAETELSVWVSEGVGGRSPDVNSVVWALQQGRAPIPFSVLAPVWHHENWNEVPLHCSDSDVRCLPKGSTEGFLVTGSPTIAELPQDTTDSPEEFWQNRRAILRSRPTDPGEPERAFGITIESVEHVVDRLILTNGAPTELTRITWREPTPWPLILSETSALLNIVNVIAGARVLEHFRIGTGEELRARHAGLDEAQYATLLEVPPAVERQGPYEADRGVRGRILRYGLRRSESDGLGWTGPRDPFGIASESAREPLLKITEVLPNEILLDVEADDPSGSTWNFHRDILTANLDSAAFTLGEGMWREVVTHQTPFEDVVFHDYASNDGWTIRFGDGPFGRPPEPGTIFRVEYFTAPGTQANLAHDSVTQLEPPPSVDPSDFLTIDYADEVTNPLPIDTGADEESPDSIRINAPEAFRALPLRAVRPEDYADILQRLDWVQRANATTRWTGSWTTDFVAVDPLGGFHLTDESRVELNHRIDCIRQATRDARSADPDYLDIDVFVRVCVKEDAYPGEVAESVEKELSSPGFFNPDHFTFGQPLMRSALEAAVQCVPGVKGVDEILIRIRRRRDWSVFVQPSLEVSPTQIIRLQNDPLHPSRGSLRVKAHGGAA